MKILSLLTSLLFLSFLTVSAGDKEEAFQSVFLEALSTSDEALFELVEFSKDGNPLFDQMLRESLVEERTRKIKEIEFGELPEDMMLEFTYEETTYIPTLPIEKEFIITYEETDKNSSITATTYRLGTKEGVYKIVSSKPKK